MICETCVLPFQFPCFCISYVTMMFHFSYPGVVTRKHFLRYGCDVVQKEFVPFFVKVDLIHVDIYGGDVLIATLDSGILKK